MDKELNELKSETITFLRWAISGIIDSVFLVIWVITQWSTNFILNTLNLSEVDKWVLLVFQILFAVSTLAPVIVYIYVDIRIMILRAHQRIVKEIKNTKVFDVTNKRPSMTLNQTIDKEG